MVSKDLFSRDLFERFEYMLRDTVVVVAHLPGGFKGGLVDLGREDTLTY
jgi:hypothetical protein